MMAVQFTGVWMETEGAALERGLKQRDPELLDALIERYQHRLFRYLLYFTRDRALAEDVFQETWLRVLERGSHYDARYRFDTWLLTVAHNLAVDQMRRRHVPAFSETLHGEAPEDSGPPEPPVSDPSPFDMAARGEQAERVAAALAGIPMYYRAALTLRFHEELSLEEIARVTGVPLSTAKSRVRRGLEMLHEQWKEERP